MLVLGIETSCDETAAGVVRDGSEILSNVVMAQPIHARYGGVVPELASRCHIRLVLPAIDEALREAGTTLDRIDGVAVTERPGLVGALLVGVSVAKALGYARGIPFVGVDHLLAHVVANFLIDPPAEVPFVCLLVSGGHTELFLVSSRVDMRSLGGTLDDAAGEAFDKVAKMLGLGYPGGPELEKLAREGNPAGVDFPPPLPRGLDFSFSGIKTSVRYYIERLGRKPTLEERRDIAASFQRVVVESLADKLLRAADETRSTAIALAGGVAANTALRETVRKRAERYGLRVSIPPTILCTDNAAIVAAAGTERLARGERDGLEMDARARSERAKGQTRGRS
ncbi:MAG: tRNA (adenosine(37)-N6)-threonylcarbamoyltransferase complex transferase subunit TsaD [Candidatus Eisenbacteria sp.]|nr:tRNA (adenosine(37)-N6)-threonylcarbamoyltransferase complex transferase subunit TsaD [Candidatus Eisenbacteria bacterium]